VPTFFVLLALAVEFYFLLAHSNRLHAVMAPQQLILDEPIKQLSLTLFRDFLLPFEMASVILLVALIGAVVLARSDESRKQKQQTTEEEAP